MERVPERVKVLQQALRAGGNRLPRAAARLVMAVLADTELLERMRFCNPTDRRHLRDSILVSAEDGGCYSVILGSEGPQGERGRGNRTRLALEGLNLPLFDLLERLRTLPVWFLAVDEAVHQVEPGEAIRLQETIYRLASLSGTALRRLALQDQLDAALDAEDYGACARIREVMDRL
ncbi:MAG: hypothetical protein ACOY93_15660 [Bacillota bacterium]